MTQDSTRVVNQHGGDVACSQRKLDCGRRQTGWTQVNGIFLFAEDSRMFIALQLNTHEVASVRGTARPS